MKSTFIILATVLHVTAFGQSSALVGRLVNRDACDRPVPFWKVTLSDESGFISESETGVDGEFRFANLMQKRYRLRVTLPSFLKGNQSFIDTTLYPAENVEVPIQINKNKELRPRFDEKENKYGYVDNDGNYVIAPQFEMAEPFDCGSAKVYFKRRKPRLHGKGWQYIDYSGQVTIPPRQETNVSEVK